MKTVKILTISLEIENEEGNSYNDIGEFIENTLMLELENEKEFGNIKSYKLEVVD